MPNSGQNPLESNQESATGNGVTEQVKQQTQQVAQQAQQKAGQVAQQAKQQTTSLAQTQKSKASQSLSQVSQALQQTGQQIQEQGQTMPGQALTKAAQQVDRLAGYLESHEVQEIVGEVEGIARRQPGMFLVGAFAAGVLLSRFLKSSPPSDAGGGGEDVNG